MMFKNRTILIVCADANVTQKCLNALRACGYQKLHVANSIEGARMELRVAPPAAIFFDESAIYRPADPPFAQAHGKSNGHSTVQGIGKVSVKSIARPIEDISLQSILTEFTEVAPVVAAIAPARRAELAIPIAGGVVDFVTRTLDFPSAAVEFLCRRVPIPEDLQMVSSSLRKDKDDDFGELLRHEVNNPLTGILGNTELLLARPEQLPPGAIERLQTIADLALRLREIVRHLSNNWEANHQPVRPV